MPRTASPYNVIDPTPEGMAAVKVALDKARADTRIDLAELPDDAADMVRRLLETYAAGRRPRVIPDDAEVSTFQAADILNVSRPYVIKLLDDGAMPFRMVGTHRRIRLPTCWPTRPRRTARRMPPWTSSSPRRKS